MWCVLPSPQTVWKPLEEITEQNGEIFEEAGGKKLRLIPCLNASEGHMKALEQIVSPYLDGMV